MVYVVIAGPTADSPSARGHLKSGVYPTLKDIAPFIVPEGPPLPLIIQCSEERVSGIRTLAEAVQRVDGGDTMEGAERFVKGVIREVEGMSIWPEIPQFYALLRSSNVRKFIAPDYDSVVIYTSGTQNYTMRKFLSFIGAFIFTLAGGDTRLKKWGLPEWQGVAGPKKYNPPEPQFPIGSVMVQALTPPPARRLASLGKANQGTGGSREGGKASNHSAVNLAGGDDGSAPFVSGTLARHTSLRRSKSRSSLPSTSRIPSDAGGSKHDIQVSLGSLNIAPDKAPPPFRLPSHLVPPSFLAHPSLQSEPLRFMTFRPRDDRINLFTLTDAAVVGPKNGPVVPRTDLPTMPFLYLRAHGWGENVITAVHLAYTSGATLTDFLDVMGTQHRMPLAEASFLWYMIQYFRGGCA